jgi:hypothetical protein
MTDPIEAGVAPKKNLWTWVFNPFYYLAGGQALALGLAFILAAGLMGSAVNAHLDGVLDAHVGLQAPIWVFPVEGLIDWLSMAVTLWGAGLLLSRTRFRALDILGTQALARVPAILLVVVAYIPGFQAQAMKLATGDFGIVPAEMAAFAVGMCVTVLMAIWMVILMYRGFAMSCNVSGGKAIGAFVVALILAEILSKAAIMGLLLVAIPGFRI